MGTKLNKALVDLSLYCGDQSVSHSDRIVLIDPIHFKRSVQNYGNSHRK